MEKRKNPGTCIFPFPSFVFVLHFVYFVQITSAAGMLPVRINHKQQLVL